jgi:hypothetical protein
MEVIGHKYVTYSADLADTGVDLAVEFSVVDLLLQTATRGTTTVVQSNEISNLWENIMM